MGCFIFRCNLEEESILFAVDVKCSEIQTHYCILNPKLLERVSHWPHRLGHVMYSTCRGLESLSMYGYMCALFLYWCCPLGIKALHSVCLQTFRRSGELETLTTLASSTIKHESAVAAALVNLQTFNIVFQSIAIGRGRQWQCRLTGFLVLASC